MAKWLITTVTSSNHYQFFIPSFLYAARRAYPDADVRVYLRGKLKKEVRAILKKHSLGEVVEDAFLDYPTRVSTCNTLRYLIPHKQFKGYDYVFIRDVDFIILPQEPTHLKYFKKVIKKTGEPYAGARGALRRPYRKHVTKHGWEGDFQRIAMGIVMLRYPDFWKACGEWIDRYRDIVKNGGHDQFDHQKACSYFEYDEVVFARICKLSHLHIPKKRTHMLNGKKLDRRYRDVHLGDFDNERLCKVKKLGGKLPDRTVTLFKKLEEDKVWQEIVEVCCLNEKVEKVFHRLRKHIKKRK